MAEGNNDFNKKKNSNLESWIGIAVVFLFGVAFITRSGGYSLKQRTYIQFIESPYKEIIGTLAILFSIVWAIYTIRKRKRKDMVSGLHP